MGPGRYRLRPTILDRTIASFRIGEGRRASHLPQFISGYPCASGWISLCPFHSPCRGNLADGNPKNHQVHCQGAKPRRIHTKDIERRTGLWPDAASGAGFQGQALGEVQQLRAGRDFLHKPRSKSARMEKPFLQDGA